jgi:hypothetical protein
VQFSEQTAVPQQSIKQVSQSQSRRTKKRQDAGPRMNSSLTNEVSSSAKCRTFRQLSKHFEQVRSLKPSRVTSRFSSRSVTDDMTDCQSSLPQQFSSQFPASAGDIRSLLPLVPSGGMCPNGHAPCPFGHIFVGSITFFGFIVSR